MVLIPMDHIGLAFKAWQVVCCPTYKRKAQGQPLKIKQQEQSPDLVAGVRASVAIISPGDLIIGVLGFDLLR